jgi:hypothetical protein
VLFGSIPALATSFAHSSERGPLRSPSAADNTARYISRLASCQASLSLVNLPLRCIPLTCYNLNEMSRTNISIFRGEEQESAKKIAGVPVSRRTTLGKIRAELAKSDLMKEDDEFHGSDGAAEVEKENVLKVLDHIIEREGVKVLYVITPEEEVSAHFILSLFIREEKLIGLKLACDDSC